MISFRDALSILSLALLLMAGTLYINMQKSAHGQTAKPVIVNGASVSGARG